ncbi:MAG: tetratricopeptide repeat protein [Sphingomicrobium sp.]
MLIVATALALAAQPQSSQPGASAASSPRVRHEQADAINLERQAREGVVNAMRDYGLALWKGQGVRRDREAAVGWFYEAAIRNDAASMFMIGRAFERGDGVGKDLKLADYWTTRAVEYGFKIENR